MLHWERTTGEFVARWKAATVSERASAQSHFNDLCALLGQQTPTEADPTGEWYAFEKSVLKTGGGQGFADVWRKGRFAWEYKGKKKNLSAAYDQLRQYEEALQNPPLLVVCDLDRFEVHTRFNGMVKRVFAFNLDELGRNVPTKTCEIAPLEVLRATFSDPNKLRPEKTTAQVTEEVAREFSKIAAQLTQRKVEPHLAARFLIRLLFCLFAEDVDLLPDRLFTRLVGNTRNEPAKFSSQLQKLFQAMAEGGDFGLDTIPYFNGGLFEDDTVVGLTTYELGLLNVAANTDWASVEVSIFGTLFERSLDPAKRAQLGAHYTSREDILLIVEPVLMAPLREKWALVRADVDELLQKRAEIDAKQVPGVQLSGRDRTQKAQISGQISSALRAFGEELGAVRVLDPACGSGNFLYVALRALLDLNKEVNALATACDVPILSLFVTPEQMRGIELSEYAHELASVTVWIGYIQWLRENGFGVPEEPILRKMDAIVQTDALVTVGENGDLSETPWPEADVIIGNPPFLGGNKIRQELGGDKVERLFALYAGRVPAFADLVCYWFERARQLIADGQVQRVGLLSTNSIRGGANRQVLERIKESGDIFMAWDDRPWVLNGAAVRVSMVGFDGGTETFRTMNGVPVTTVNADLTGASFDLTVAKQLLENRGICFMGPSPKAPFDIDAATAQRMLSATDNSNAKPNSDIVRRVASAVDLVQGSRGKWTIDFAMMSEADSAQYSAPFAYVKKNVYPIRSQNRRAAYAEKWWQFAEARPGMRKALVGLSRYIATPAVAKHRLFVWMPADTLCNQGTYVVARDDDYFYGVLHSKAHEIWALRMGTFLGVGNDPRYTASTTFETFPFPWPPGKEPQTDPKVTAIADAARALVSARDAWLNPPASDTTPVLMPRDLAKRTLTNLYNAPPDWLRAAHARLDAAVFAAYGWASADKEAGAAMGEGEILERLLALNGERRGAG